MKRIPKIPQGEISSIKNILYPDLKPKDKKIELKNWHNIKIIEEKRRKSKEENIPNELNKNINKKIPLLLKNNNIKTIVQKTNKTPKTPINKNELIEISKKKPSTSNQRKKSDILINNNKEEENIYNILNDKKESMFDNYYSKRIRAKTPSLINHINNNKIEYKNQNINLINNINQKSPYDINGNENIYNFGNKDTNNANVNPNICEINKDLSYDIINIIEEPKINDSNEIERLILEYKLKYGSDEALENIIKDYSQNKQNTNINNLSGIPEVDEKLESTMKRQKNIILPKIQKNYIKENRKLIIENKIQIKHKNIDENNNNIKHKNYGKVPYYIKRYELERELKKEEIKRQKEAEKIPKGTKLLSEEERMNTLNSLINNKKELINQLEKMPIAKRTMATQNKREEIVKQLEEIEKGIEMFSKKKVYIKI